MDRLEAMSLLLGVIERGSFTAASRHMRVPLATLSRKVSELEAHLGTKLLVRTTRKLALTDAGAAYLSAARRILEQVDEAERTAAGAFSTPRGELVLTAPVLFGRLQILPIVAEFLRTYPEINIRLLLSDRNLHLVEDHVDMAVRIGVLPDSSTIATRVGSMRRVVCVSPTLFAANGTPKTPEDLTKLPCVNFDFPSPRPTWRFHRERSSDVFDLPIQPRLSVSTAEAAVWAAAEGVGVTRVLQYQCAEAVRAGHLKLILEDFEPEPLPVHLLHAARGELPTKMRAFLDFAAARLRPRLRPFDRPRTRSTSRSHRA